MRKWMKAPLPPHPARLPTLPQLLQSSFWQDSLPQCDGVLKSPGRVATLLGVRSQAESVFRLRAVNFPVQVDLHVVEPDSSLAAVF